MWGEGYLELIWPCTPPPLPAARSRFSAGGAEAIESELDLIALLMTKPHFSIDLRFCSLQRAASNCSSGGSRGKQGFLHPHHPPQHLPAAEEPSCGQTVQGHCSPEAATGSGHVTLSVQC